VSAVLENNGILPNAIIPFIGDYRIRIVLPDEKRANRLWDWDCKTASEAATAKMEVWG
jgi:hypothetical protein